MVKKLEYAYPAYYCKLKVQLQKEGFGEKETECINSPIPDCRVCGFGKKNKWILDRSGL